MKSIGFIPLRKGSKSIPGKNKRKLVGRPLFTWVLAAAIQSDLDQVYVFTDDEWIENFIANEYQWTAKVQTIRRPESTATDTASTEAAMLEFSQAIQQDYDVLCLLQATSPFTTASDINTCMHLLSSTENDSVVSVVRTHRFLWNEDGTAANYDVFQRPRRQEFMGQLIENGAIYMTTKQQFERTHTRIGATSALYVMNPASYYELDEVHDWPIVENLLIHQLKKDKQLAQLTHLVLDVDGVFTDGHVTYTKEGEHSKRFDMRDGMGLELLRETGVQVVVMTSEHSPIVSKRMQKLGIPHVFLGVKDKLARLQHFCSSQGISLNAIAYMGDDINDLAPMCSVGWSLTPANAMAVIKQHADTILPSNGGNGAIRDACDFIQKYNQRF